MLLFLVLKVNKIINANFIFYWYLKIKGHQLGKVKLREHGNMFRNILYDKIIIEMAQHRYLR